MSKYEFDLSVGIKEVLDADSAKNVENRIKKQKAELEQPIEIKVNKDDAEKKINKLIKASEKLNKELNDAVSSNKSFKEIDTLVKKHELLKKEIKGITSELDKNNKARKRSNEILRDTQKIIDSISVAQVNNPIEEAIKANNNKKKSSKIKLREFTQEEYDAYQEKYKKENDGNVESLEDTIDLIRQASQFGTKFAVDMETSCKRATTAVNRFFSMIDAKKYPALASWKDSILESVQNGYFSEVDKYNGMNTGAYSWGVEALDDNRYYVYLNLLDVVKDKEKEYSEYLKEEFKKRDEGLEKEDELITKIYQTYEKLNDLHKNEPNWDRNNEIQSIRERLKYYEQEKELLQDINNCKEELFNIPGKYRGQNVSSIINTEQNDLRLGDYGNATLKDNEKSIAFYTNELERAIKKQEKLNLMISEQKDERVNELNKLIKNQNEWVKYLNQALNEDNFKTSSKKEATDQLRRFAKLLVEKRKTNYEDAIGAYEKEMTEVMWMNAYKEAQRQNVASSTLSRYNTDAVYSYDQNLKILKDEYNYRQKVLNQYQEELNLLQNKLELNTQNTNAVKDEEELKIIKKENGALEEKLELLQEIAEQYANNISQRDRNRYEELNQKDMDSGLTSREEERYWELGEKISEADEQLEEFGKTYDKILLKLYGGKTIKILPDDSGLKKFDKIANEFYSGEYDGIEIEDIIFERAIENTNELTDATKELIKAKKELNNIVYHAGDLSNITKTLKSFPLGNVVPYGSPGVINSIFGGLTELYTTEDVGQFWANEWDGAPISSIDLSQYKLFDAKDNDLAIKVNDFFTDLNATIYGYLEYFDYESGELAKTTDVKTTRELYSTLKEVFKSVSLDFDTFNAFIERSKSIVAGHDFADLELPSISEGIAKSGISKVLQVVSDDVLNADSFPTQLMKMLGFEGIDLRGTRYNGTYSGGTVIFDIKPESLKTINEKWSDVMSRNGYEISDEDLKREEKRRQLAFDTAKAYSKITEEASSTSDLLNDIADSIDVESKKTEEIKNNKKLTISYDELIKKVKEYAEIKKKAVSLFDENKDFSDLVPTLREKEYDIAKYFPVSAEDPMFSTSGIEMMLQSFPRGINENTLIENLCYGLGIEIPAAAENGASKIEEIKKQMTDFTNKYAELLGTVNEGTKLTNKYNSLLSEVSTGALSAADAIEQLNAYIKENNLLISKSPTVIGISQPTTPKGITIDAPSSSYVSPYSEAEMSSFLKGINIDKFVKGYNIRDDKQNEIKEDVRQLFSMVAESAQKDIEGNAAESDRLMGLVSEQVAKVVDSISEHSQGAREKVSESEQAFVNECKDFIAYARQYPLAYDVSELEELKYFKDNNINKYTKGKYKILSNSESGLKLDRKWESLFESFPNLFTGDPKEIASQGDQIIAYIEAFDKAIETSRTSKMTTNIPFTDADSIILEETLNKLIGQVYDNTTKVNEAKEGQITLIEQATNKTKEQLKAEAKAAKEAEKAAKAKEKAAKERQDLLDSGVATEVSAEELVRRDVENYLKQLRSAKDNKTPLIDLSQVYSGEDLTDQFTSMATKIAEETNLAVKSVKVTSKVADIQLYNKELGVTVKQIWRIKEAADEADSAILELLDAEYKHDIEALNKNKVDAKYQQKLANAKIDDLIAPLKGQPYKGTENLRNLANGIVDKNSLEAFDKELEVSRIEVRTLSKEISNSLNTFDVMSKKMGNAAEQIQHFRNEIKSLKGTKGIGGLKKNIGDMWSANEDYIKETDLNKKAEAYERYKKAEQAYKSNKVLVEDTKRESDAIANLDSKMQNVNIDLQTMLMNLNKLGNVPGADKILNTLSDMETAAKEFQKATTLEDKQIAYDKYASGLSKYTSEMQNLKATQQEQAATQKESENSIKSYYRTLIDTLQQISSLDSKINSLKTKDGGTGTYLPLIDSLEAQKSELLAKISDISKQMKAAFQGSFHEGYDVKLPFSSLLNNLDDTNASQRIESFFSDARVQAVLTEQEIDKFITLLQKSQTSIEEFAANLMSKFVSIREAANEISKLENTGIINTDSQLYQNALTSYADLEKYKESLPKDATQWTGEQTLVFQKLMSDAEQYMNVLSKVAQKEAQYFSGKTRYTQDTTMSTLADQTEKESGKIIAVREKLTKSANEFAQESGASGAIVTNFVQSADGISKLDFSILDQGTNSLRRFRMEMGSVTEGTFITETTVNNSISKIQAAAKQLESISNLIERLKLSDVVMDQSSIANLKDIQEKLFAEYNKGDTANNTMLEKLTKDAKISAAEIEKLYNKSIQLRNAIENGNAEDLGKINLNGDVYTQMIDGVNKFASTQPNATLAISDFNKKTNTLKFTLTDTSREVRTFEARLDSLTGQVGAQQVGVKQLDSIWTSFKTRMVRSGKQIATALVGYNVLYEIISQIRRGIEYVREVDLALTELKKVTNETESAYAQFLDTASKTSGIIGSTLSDFTNATANFARLGYSMEESAKMAETAIIYKNVADGLDSVEESTESIISTMKAFSIESYNTMGIIDKFNEVGNNFAITSAGIGEALQRSAAALYEGGNTIDEAIALVTAGNSVIQNPDQVGTALKTLSLRLRGAKVELEEAGESTDGMANSVSQLQAKLLALTKGKVNIMLDADTFKSTTQILREMSEAWEDMTDIEQASALELMGGKRQANILASIISNFSTVEDVIETSLNSEGSAIKENERYLDSVQGRIDLFTNSLQTFWNNTLSSDALKFIIDLGTAIIKLVDAIGLLPTAFGGFAAFSFIEDGIKKDFAAINSGTINLSNVLKKYKEEIMAASSAETVKTTASNKAAAADNIEAEASNKAAVADNVEAEASNKAAVADNVESTASNKAAAADNAESISSIGNGAASFGSILSGGIGAFGSGASKIAAKGLGKLATKGVSIIARGLVGGLVGVGVSILLSTVFDLIGGLGDLHKSQEEVAESAQKVIDNYSVAKKELSETKSTVDGFTSDFSKLSHGVDQFGNNISLSTAEYKRYNEIVNQIADMFPEMVTGYTAEGNAILSCKGNVDALTEAYEAQAAAARQAAIAGSGDVFKTFKNNYNKDTLAFWQDSGIKQQKELAEQIVELYSQGDYDSLNKLFREGSLINDARYNELSDLLDSAGIEKNNIWKHNIYGDVADFILPVNLYGHIDEEQFEKEITKIQSFIKSSATKISTETTGLKSVIEAYIGEDEDYKKLESTYKTFIDNIVNSLDAEFLDSFESEVDIYEWVRKNYIEPISDPKIHKEFISAIEEMFNLQDKLDSGDISLNEYNNKIISFVDAINSLDIDDEAVKQLANVFGISADDVIAYSNEIDTLQNKINTLADQYNSKINGNIDYSKRPIITAEEMINAGWVDFDGEYATTYDSGYGIKDSIGKDYSIVITPIVTTPDGTEILSPKDLDDYVYNYLSGSDNIIEADKVENGGKGILINAAEGLWTDKQFEEFNDKIQEIKDEHLEFSLELQEKVGDSTSKVFNDQINAMIGNAKEILAKEDWSKLNTLSISDLRIIDGFEVPDGVTYSWDKLTQKIQEAKKEIGTGISFETYSALTESLDKYNEIFNQSSEIITKNTEVTQEYKDSLIELGIAEEDLNEYFYEGNDLVVKDADGLKKLLKQSKANIASNVKLAKSQAKLEYYDLYKQIRQLTGGKRIESQATLDQVNALYAQMGALERTIAKYSILEQKLLGAADAYDTFAEAQTIDEEIDYGSKAEEMVGAIAEAFNTSELGTEAAQAAITGMIPESVFEDCDTLEEKLDAIYKYFTTGTVSKLFTIEFDDEGAIQSIEMTKENLEAFVDEMAKTEVDLGKGIMGTVFEGSWDEGFELNDSITSLEQFAEACNMTEAAAFAFLTSLEKYDVSWLNGDFSTMMDKLMGDNLEYKIYNNINALAELEVQMANGKISAKEYAKQYAELSSSQEQNAQSARENIAAWRENEEQLSKAKEHLQKISKALNELKDAGDGAVYEGKTYKEWQIELQKTEGECQKLIDKKSELEQPGELIFQVSLDEVQKELEILETELNAQGIDVKANIVWDEEKKEYIWVGTKFDKNDPKKKAVEEYLALITEERNIEVMQGEEVPTVLDTLQEIAELLDNIYKLQVETDEAESSVNDFLKVYNEIKDKGVVVTLAGKISEGLSSLWKKVTGEDLKEDKSTTTSYATKKSSSYKKVRGYTRADGTAHANGSWGAPKTETALVGELGPEMLVRNGRWTTVGENGAEFTEVKRGDIIFNHKQTEDLLSKGYVTSRGKAYASGTAYARTYSIGGVNTYDKHYGTVYKDYGNNKNSSSKDAKDDFKEIFDWFEVRLEELNEDIDLMSAKLENAVSLKSKNNILDDMIGKNKELISDLEKGKKLYDNYAAELLKKVPKQYREAAKNGKIAIETFAGEADEAELEAIQNYREWAQKAADVRVQLQETRKQVAELAKQKFDNIAERYERNVGISDHIIQQYEDMVDLQEKMGNPISENYYNSMIAQNRQKLSRLETEKAELQKSLDESVRTGDVKKYSEEWWDMVNQIYEVDHAIDKCTASFEEYQNAINEIHWNNFDELINRLGYLSDETQNLIDLMGKIEEPVIKPAGKYIKYKDGTEGTIKFWTEDDVKWSEEGLTQLGLYAQQMELAEYQSKKYKEEIAYLNKEYAAGKYSQTEYYEKLNELKNAQYDSIEAYYDARDAIKDLQEARVDMIKEGIEKEIDAYEELINKKKEELDAEKDLYDFQKSTREQQKNIADIQRKLTALSTDNSASAIAERKRLEAELVEAKQDLEDTYYDRSIDQRQEALDNELDSFQKEKEKEIEKWEEYLEDVEKVVADSLLTVQNNATTVYNTLSGKADEYGLTLSNAITEPWKKGENAVANYDKVFGNSASSTIGQLKLIEGEWDALIGKMDAAAKIDIANQKQADRQIIGAEKAPTTTNNTANKNTNNNTNTNTNKNTNNTNSSSGSGTIKTGGKINAGSAKIYDYKGDTTGEKQYYSKDPVYKVLKIDGSWLQVRYHKLSSGVSGWFKKGDVKAYAKGSKKINKDQLALIDELGEELILRPDGNGRLSFLEKGTGVVPADLTSNLMAWGELDPSVMLERNRPSVGMSPEIHNTEINIDCSVGELIHIDHCDQSTLPDVEKIVNKAIEKNNQKMNESLRRFVR